MSNEAAVETAARAVSPTSDNDANGGGQQPVGDGEKKFTQADFDAALKKALDLKEERARKAALESEEERKRKDAEAAGKWEEVNKQLTDKVQRLEEEKAALERQQLQARVATQTGLPPQLADRLRGESEEEMAADAAAILALMPKPDKTPAQGNGNNPPPKGKAADVEDEKAARAAHASITSRI